LGAVACTNAVPEISSESSQGADIQVLDPVSQAAITSKVLEGLPSETIQGSCSTNVNQFFLKSKETGNKWISVSQIPGSHDLDCGDGNFSISWSTSSGPLAMDLNSGFATDLVIRGVTLTNKASDWPMKLEYFGVTPVLIQEYAVSSVHEGVINSVNLRLSKMTTETVQFDYELIDVLTGEVVSTSVASVGGSSSSFAPSTMGSQNFNISTVDMPGSVCDDKVLRLRIKNLVGAKLGTQNSFSINDGRPSVSLKLNGPSTNYQFSEGLSQPSFPIELSANCQLPIRIPMSAVSTTPTFNPFSDVVSSISFGQIFVVTIPPNSGTLYEWSLPIQIIDDAVDEPSESINWSFAGTIENATIGSNVFLSSEIVDNDIDPTMTLTQVAQYKENDLYLLIQASLDRPTEKIATPSFLASVGGPAPQATTPGDFTATVNFYDVNASTLGLSRQSFYIYANLVDDDVWEADTKYFIVATSVDPSNYGFQSSSGPLQLVAQISENELPPTLSLVAPTAILSGGPINMKFELSGKIDTDIVINYRYLNSDLGALTPILDSELSCGATCFSSTSDISIGAGTLTGSFVVNSSVISTNKAFAIKAENVSGVSRAVGLMPQPASRIVEVLPFTADAFSITGVGRGGLDVIYDDVLNYFNEDEIPSTSDDTITITWTVSAGASSYNIEVVDLNSEGVCEMLVGVAVTTATLGNCVFSKGGTYRVRVSTNTSVLASNNDFSFYVNRPPSVGRTQFFMKADNVFRSIAIQGGGASLQATDPDSDLVSFKTAFIPEIISPIVSVQVGTLLGNSLQIRSFLVSDGPVMIPERSQLLVKIVDSRGYEKSVNLDFIGMIENSTWVGGGGNSNYDNPANWCGTVKTDLTGCNSPAFAPMGWDGGSIFFNGQLIDTPANKNATVNIPVSHTGNINIVVKSATLTIAQSLQTSNVVILGSGIVDVQAAEVSFGTVRVEGAAGATAQFLGAITGLVRLSHLSLKDDNSTFIPRSGTISFESTSAYSVGGVSKDSGVASIDFGKVRLRLGSQGSYVWNPWYNNAVSHLLVRINGELSIEGHSNISLSGNINAYGDIVADQVGTSFSSNGKIVYRGTTPKNIRAQTSGGFATFTRLQIAANAPLTQSNSDDRILILREFTHDQDSNNPIVTLHRLWLMSPRDSETVEVSPNTKSNVSYKTVVLVGPELDIPGIERTSGNFMKRFSVINRNFNVEDLQLNVLGSCAIQGTHRIQFSRDLLVASDGCQRSTLPLTYVGTSTRNIDKVSSTSPLSPAIPNLEIQGSGTLRLRTDVTLTQSLKAPSTPQLDFLSDQKIVSILPQGNSGFVHDMNGSLKVFNLRIGNSSAVPFTVSSSHALAGFWVKGSLELGPDVGSQLVFSFPSNANIIQMNNDSDQRMRLKNLINSTVPWGMKFEGSGDIQVLAQAADFENFNVIDASTGGVFNLLGTLNLEKWNQVQTEFQKQVKVVGTTGYGGLLSSLVMQQAPFCTAPVTIFEVTTSGDIEPANYRDYASLFSQGAEVDPPTGPPSGIGFPSASPCRAKRTHSASSIPEFPPLSPF